MKLKPSIGIPLVVCVAACLWLWFRPRPALLQPAPDVSSTVKPEPAPAVPLHPVPANAPKMKTVKAVAASPSRVPSTALAPSWSAAQKIVDQRVSSMERQQAIRSLAGHMTDLDWEVLEPFLLQADGQDKVQTGQVLKNQLMDVLCAMNPPPPGLGDDLVKIYRDRAQDGVIRDYAVQHLSAYYGQISPQPNSAPAQQSVPTTGLFAPRQVSPNSVPAQQAVQAALWEAVQEPGGSIGGTALLALERLSREYAGFDQDKIAATALQMASDSNAGELTHITALQVCAHLGTADALPVILSAARNGESISVKMSAIGALGSLGGSEQVPFLNEVLAGTEDRLKPAAQHALEQINTRKDQVASQK